MKKRWKVLIALASVISLAFWGYVLFVLISAINWFAPTHIEPFRYRITVEVETPQGLVTGSAVRENRISVGRTINGGLFQSKIRGEAVVVDLPNGETLYALLDSNIGKDHPLFWLRPQMKDCPSGMDEDYRSCLRRNVDAMLASPGKIVEVPKVRKIGARVTAQYPRIVRFRNPNDPSSVEFIEPESLPGIFGHGYSFKRITVQISNDKITTDISKRLPSPLYKGFYNWDGDMSSWNSEKIVGIGNFQKGVTKVD